MRTYIDTDPGLDDSLAILAALRSPELDLRGIIAVAGNIGLSRTVRNAGSLVALGGRPAMPVLAGAAEPLARAGIEAAHVHGDDGIGAVALPEPAREPVAGFGPDWLAEDILAGEGLVQILALGPLTNVALLLRRHPGVRARIARIVAMGGAIRVSGNVGPRSEFNIAADPEASAEVIASGLPVTLIPLDLTRQVRAGPDWVAGLVRGGPVARTSAALVAAYIRAQGGTMPLHDPTVILHALALGLFGGERMRLSVALSGSDDPGAITAEADAASPVTVLLQADAPAALALLSARLHD